MPLYISDSLPSFRLDFSGNEFNEYRFRQGRVEFRASLGVWRVLEDEDIQFHLVLHTEVAKWLVKHITKTSGDGAAQDSDQPIANRQSPILIVLLLVVCQLPIAYCQSLSRK